MRHFASALALGLAVAACSSEPEQHNETLSPELTQEVPPTAPAPEQRPAAEAGVPVPAASPLVRASPSPESSPSPAAAPAHDRTLALEGLNDLKIGAAVPQRSSWAERGAQIDGDCRTVSSPRYPGVYAIVSGGMVRRITVGERADVKLIENIGVGTPERIVRQTFPTFREEPHKYEDAPAKYLTAPNAARGAPALRFGIGADRRVSLIHVGTMPVLGYVEGCA